MSRIASYRLQLRDGMTFDAAIGRLDRIAKLGVSHLYLSPILTAAPGSTHGYDVTDPTEIDPTLGGREGFERLSRAAQDKGLQIILDIVPNHMAFGLDTPWLVDVLRHGPDSVHGDVFDIDWERGPLVLPWLDGTLADYELRIEDDELHAGPIALPLAPGTGKGALDDVLARQHWQLVPWQLERDSITHRRFFSVTSLIGLRIEDEAVFDKTHDTVLDLARTGLIHGLRVDHVDGLVDPGAYLRRLTDRLPNLPVWVEKILVTDETLPDWPVAGTTGYEAAAVIGRALTSTEGLSQIDTAWREAGEIEGEFHAAVEQAKHEVLTDELAAELRQLRGFAQALADREERPVGPEMLREALTELLVAFPRYRSYIGEEASEDDRRIWEQSADRAAANVRDRATIDWIVEGILAADSPEARRLGVRMEQVTGALLAKAHEDTAGFRFNRYLAANEVGADPDRPTATDAEIAEHLSQRQSDWTASLTLGSSHDTKRSEDARARILAISHAPDAFLDLFAAARALPQAEGLDPNRLFYAAQVSLALWGEPEAAERVADHMVKALREGKEVSYWTAPDEEREGRMQDFVRAAISSWEDRPPKALHKLVRLGEGLSLSEVALRLCWPGMPDIYQGGEGALFQLTDPDNRRAPDWDALAALEGRDGFAATKADLVRTLLALRREDPDLFERGAADWSSNRGVRRMIRRFEGRSVEVVLGDVPGAMWQAKVDPWPVSIIRS